jgi:uncharacterized membrane protein
MTIKRFWEIDFIRGVAVVLMLFFHTIWDLASFDAIALNVSSFSWQLFGKSIGFIFIFILGLSLTLSQNKETKNNSSVWRKSLRRGSILLGLGSIVSIVTYFVFDRQYVRFGILHLLGTSIILAYPFLRFSWWHNAIFGCSLIALGNYLLTLGVDYPWFIPFGLMQWGVSMVDYYPIFPWFGEVLLAIAAGNLIYYRGDRQFRLEDYSNLFFINWLVFLGRHSLFIYLIHQPIILGLLVLTGIIPLFEGSSFSGTTN